jgi:hypothetical protein
MPRQSALPRRYCRAETRFAGERGEVALIDMPLTDDEEKVDVVRIVRGIRGEMPMRMELILRFGQGHIVPWVRCRDYGLSAVAGRTRWSCTNAPLEGREMTTCSEFTFARRQRAVHALVSRLSQDAAFRAGPAREPRPNLSAWREWTKRGVFEFNNREWRTPWSGR